MGDIRFVGPYRSVRESSNRATATAGLSDDEVVQALAAASRERDPYVANVLASEAMNRMRRARTVFEHIGEGVCLLTPHGTVRAMNPAAMRMLGWTPEEVAREPSHDALHAGGPCPVCRAMTERVTVESDACRLATLEGPLPVSCVIAPIVVEDELEGFVMAFRDVTDRVSWTSLIEAFYHLHDVLGIGLVITEGEQLHYANDAFRAMVGRTLEELKAERHLLALVVPEERAMLEAAFAPSRWGDPSRPVRAHLLCRDGKRVPVDLYVTVAKEVRGSPPRYVCLVQPVEHRVPVTP